MISYKKIIKRLAQFFLIIIMLILLFPIIVTVFSLTPDYTKKLTDSGYPINTIKYIQLDDKTNIWISVWLPENLSSKKKIPTLIETSRYAEHFEMGWFYKCLQVLSFEDDNSFKSAKPKLDNEYAYVWIQSPGSCQSSGPRNIEYPPNEIDAINSVIDWIIKQPWSNQKVGAIGGSYSGTTAEMSCATIHPALKVVVSKAPDFDPYQVNAQPGGLMSETFIKAWANMIYEMDQNDVVGVVEAVNGKMSFIEKLILKSQVKKLKEPNKEDIEIYNTAIENHKKNIKPEKLIKLIEFKDLSDKSSSNLSIGDIALYNYKHKIEEAQVNTYTLVGWMDAAVAEGALQKYLTINSPQVLTIYPTGHVLSKLSDPYDTLKTFSKTEKEEFKNTYWSYLDKNLKSDSEKEERIIRYFTYGINKWQETTVWPPEGTEYKRWYFNENNSLTTSNAINGFDKYIVDFTATSGTKNRWISQMGKHVIYNDRINKDMKLLTYTSDPLIEDVEITGSPTVTLFVSSTHKDGAFHVYLEDITPNGKAVYLTEGLLRAIHRKEQPVEDAPYVPLGVYHSYYQSDTLSIVPGEVTKIKITLYPISAVFKKGHSIRVSIAGHDASMQSKYPQEGTPILNIEHNLFYKSNIEMPVIKQID
jgi:putative CocE/NonD family hydrolase